MAETARRMALSSILLIAVSITGQGASTDSRSRSLPPWRIQRDILRFNTVATDNVMKLLAIRPGMTILDIGAGTGQFAYDFAGKLNGTGNVYATDTQDSCIDYMKKEAGRRGLGNLHPVLGEKEGVDAFYGKHRYDLITGFHTCMVYEDRVDYFREMRSLLSADGRLVLILYKIPAPFSPGDFTGDIRELINVLLRESPESPYHWILKDSTRKLLRDHPEAKPPEEIRKAIVDDFNEVLSDTRFAPHFFFDGSEFRKETRFLPDEQGYADWVLPQPPGTGVRSAEYKPQRAAIDGRFSTINKLLIIQRYRRFLRTDGLFRSGFTSPIRAAFEKAGYKLAGEHSDVVPFEDLIVFTAH